MYRCVWTRLWCAPVLKQRFVIQFSVCIIFVHVQNINMYGLYCFKVCLVQKSVTIVRSCAGSSYCGQWPAPGMYDTTAFGKSRFISGIRVSLAKERLVVNMQLPTQLCVGTYDMYCDLEPPMNSVGPSNGFLKWGKLCSWPRDAWITPRFTLQCGISFPSLNTRLVSRNCLSVVSCTRHTSTPLPHL